MVLEVGRIAMVVLNDKVVEALGISGIRMSNRVTGANAGGSGGQ